MAVVSSAKVAPMDAAERINAPELTEYLKAALTGPGAHIRRAELIDRMYDNLQANGNQDSVLTASQFARYEILFNSALREKILSNKISFDELDQIYILSDELYHTVNPQRPIHIVDDVTHEEICPPLPPLILRVNMINKAHNEYLDQIYTLVNTDDGNPNGMNQVQQAMALNGIAKSIVENQDQEELLRQINQSRDLMKRFHDEVLSPQGEQKATVYQDPNAPTLNPTAPQSLAQQNQNTGFDDMSMMTFAPLPDDDEDE